ncbi:uncharacterized protein LOC112511344 isoform X2 [Cynara cardunculus var. scolymus]|uniref:uncharacterized protein LOC112511344 isoform X2 n=1 Tax=Cynara cardunculus var. scolymus TaxID=59895 RepID=UPI000D6246E4|nr:uncharacterized protein LOC112511344 isoform X2 [Cynara cardunculus var. scolymus]
MATIGWYGPLIDLSEASSHRGHFVQLLVLVHKTIPIQYKTSGGGKVIRTDIQVGDDTRPYFPVSIWQKHMGSMLTAGNIILLENVKVMRFGDVVEARTVQQSSVQCLVETYEAIHSQGPTLNKHVSHNRKKNQNSSNWKLPEEMQTKDCLSLLEVSNLNDSCNVSLFASIGEMFLPTTTSSEFEEERMFIRSRISCAYENLAEDLLCTGCQLCGAPLNSEFGSRIEQETPPLYCQKSSNRLHIVSFIYRPFLLYIWDDSTCIPVVVKNKAAELLVGNMKAESVYTSYKKQACRNEGINFYSLWLILLKALLLQPGNNSPLKFKLRIDMTNNWDNGRFEMISVSLPH